jgi:hypothetical protein
MRLEQCVAIDRNPMIEPASVRKLRPWSATQTILVATNLSDELTILPPAITQARESSARILLAHVVNADLSLSAGQLRGSWRAVRSYAP